MISFALFSVLAEGVGFPAHELTAVDLNYEGFTFRLSPEENHELFPSGQALFTRLHCTVRGLVHASVFDMDSFSVTLEEQTPYFSLYRVTTDVPDIQRHLRELMKDLSDYTLRKNNLDDPAFSACYTEYPAAHETEYDTDFFNWRRHLFSSLIADDAWEAAASGIDHWTLSLSAPETCRLFAEHGLAEAWCCLLHRAGLEKHPLMRIRPDSVCIGSSWCPELFPKPGQLSLLLNRCKADSVTPFICFPPLQEHYLQNFATLLPLLPEGTEIIVNDCGTPAMIHTAAPGRFRMTAGPLLIRRRKDPRIQWWTGDVHSLYTVSADSPTFSRWLDSIGISGMCCESCGYPIHTRGFSNMFFPFYQLSTATRCLMPSVVRTGKRNYLPEGITCSRECGHRCILYGNALNTVGRFNSLFAADTGILTDSAYLKKLLSGSLSRMILELL